MDAPVSVDVHQIEQRRELAVRETDPERPEQLEAEGYGTQGACEVALSCFVAGSGICVFVVIVVVVAVMGREVGGLTLKP